MQPNCDIDLHLRQAVQALIRVALRLWALVLAGLLPVAAQLRRVQVVVLVLQRVHGPVADLEQVRLVRQVVLGGHKAHLLPQLLLLLPLHGLLGVPPLVPAALLHLLGELLLELLVGLLLRGARVALVLRGLGGLVAEHLRDGLVDIVRPAGLRLGLAPARGLLLRLPRRPLGLLALPHDLHPPLQQRCQVLPPEHLEVVAEVPDLVRRGRVVGHALPTLSFEHQPVVQHQDLGGVRGLEKVLDADAPAEVVAGVVAAAVLPVPALQVLHQGLLHGPDLCGVRGRERVQRLHEDPPRIEEPRVDLDVLKAQAHHEDLRRDISGRRRLGGVHLGEELLEHPHQGVVVGRAEDLGDERPAGTQVLASELQGVQGQLVLPICVLGPIGADVRRAVVQDDIGPLAQELLLQHAPALVGGDVRLHAGHAVDGLDGAQVDGYDQGP
mmetsp:Transcript_86075/g.240854  ORF Transcript_86075/g.240854 Transcript_86075/m.240854 type:complete len:440 (+) Transcript_86075:1598-2917(+)